MDALFDRHIGRNDSANMLLVNAVFHDQWSFYRNPTGGDPVGGTEFRDFRHDFPDAARAVVEGLLHHSVDRVSVHILRERDKSKRLEHFLVAWRSDDAYAVSPTLGWVSSRGFQLSQWIVARAKDSARTAVSRVKVPVGLMLALATILALVFIGGLDQLRRPGHYVLTSAIGIMVAVFVIAPLIVFFSSLRYRRGVHGALKELGHESA